EYKRVKKYVMSWVLQNIICMEFFVTGQIQTCNRRKQPMVQHVLTRHSLRATIFATALLLWCMVLAAPMKVAAQTDNDDKKPAVQRPSDNMNAVAQKKNESHITETELQNFDQFLDSHPQIASDLKKNPSLIDDQNYLNSHPQLA